MIEKEELTIMSIVFMSIFILSLLIIYIVIKFKKNKKNTKGLIFEKHIKEKIKQFAKNNNLILYSNVFINQNNKMNCELDALMITEKIVFIFETKYYEGKITGEANNKTINLLKNNKTKVLKNPIYQNFMHIKQFYNALGFKIPVLSIVVFPDNNLVEINNLPNWTVIANDSNLILILEDIINSTNQRENIDPKQIEKLQNFLK
ncbi:nuclease-related domain-containing protein [Mycoplasma sp. 744]|uniref:nuclease-related domain-containing protein n=1 Tax=Mycoplasma sp. 744 TaxID=3108531 RepID=UPI002B1E668C|nr:nuclease-related domain-containing protein [Mycoplasma sp. 744]MEA4115545.1 nuclease-related domain-containing protein [Mycoplasma sp. 744]